MTTTRARRSARASAAGALACAWLLFATASAAPAQPADQPPQDPHADMRPEMLVRAFGSVDWSATQKPDPPSSFALGQFDLFVTASLNDRVSVLAEIVLGTQNWPHGRRITVVLREKGQREPDEAIRIICGLSERDYERYLPLQTFRGAVTRGPRSIQSATCMLRFVVNTPGAIGDVPAGKVDDSVKVLAVDGRLPGDPDYTLQRRVGRVNWLAW